MVSSRVVKIHHVVKVKDSDVASLRSATKSYGFFGTKEIADSVKSRKEKFLKMNPKQQLIEVSVFGFTLDTGELL